MITVSRIYSFVVARLRFGQNQLGDPGLILTSISTAVQSILDDVNAILQIRQTVTTVAAQETYDIAADVSAIFSVVTPWDSVSVRRVERHEYEMLKQSDVVPESEPDIDTLVTPRYYMISRSASSGKYQISFYPYEDITAGDEIYITYNQAEYVELTVASTITTLDSSLETYLKWKVLADVALNFLSNENIRLSQPAYDRNAAKAWSNWKKNNTMKNKAPISYVDNQFMARQF